VRELENILERAMTLCEGDEIHDGDLGLTSSDDAGEAARAGEDRGDGRRAPALSDDLDSVLEDVERQTILDALEKTRWNKTAAARTLGISFGALRYRMQKFGLD